METVCMIVLLEYLNTTNSFGKNLHFWPYTLLVMFFASQSFIKCCLILPGFYYQVANRVAIIPIDNQVIHFWLKASIT